jgi:hypothetical protein
MASAACWSARRTKWTSMSRVVLAADPQGPATSTSLSEKPRYAADSAHPARCSSGSAPSTRAPPAGFEPATHGLGIAPDPCHCVRTRPYGQLRLGAIPPVVHRIPPTTAQWMGKRMGNSFCPSGCPSRRAAETAARRTRSAASNAGIRAVRTIRAPFGVSSSGCRNDRADRHGVEPIEHDPHDAVGVGRHVELQDRLPEVPRIRMVPGRARARSDGPRRAPVDVHRRSPRPGGLLLDARSLTRPLRNSTRSAWRTWTRREGACSS